MDDGAGAFITAVVICVVLHVFVVVPHYRKKAVDNGAATWSITDHGKKEVKWNDSARVGEMDNKER